ncbi:hypothetical protein EGT07_17935 [Herbaspirillum sp. HC18]|nr:hypothetical protein EGT07_17935 [Herbaspirillum sp. HC18]
MATKGVSMNRYKASVLHLLCSGIVLSLIFGLVRWIWYPGQLFEAASGTDLVVIMISVDVVLGPLITLIIFNPKKTSLKFDMACVIFVQVSFMLYGAWAIFSARPVYMAFVANNFYMVTANEIDPEDQKNAQDPMFQSLPLFGPRFVGTRIPTDQKVVRDIMAASRQGMGLQNLPQYFLPFELVAPSARTVGKTVRELSVKATAPKEELDKLIAYESEKRAAGKQVLFIPLLNKKKVLTVAIDGTTGAVLDIL